MVTKLKDIAPTFNESKQDWIYIGNFLDEFYRSDSDTMLSMIEDEPEWNENSTQYIKSFCSAMVAKLAEDYKLIVPKWVMKPEYFQLKDPHFAMNAKGTKLRQILIEESPKQFRIRNIFTTSNVLFRV